MRRALFFAVALLLSLSCAAETLKTEDDLRPFSDRVMEGLLRGDTAATLRTLRPYCIMTDAEFDKLVSEAVATRDEYRKRAGKTLGFDFFSQTRMGDVMTRLTYGERASQLRLTWVFFYSKSPDGWTLNNFHVR